MANNLELGMISSTWLGTKVGLEEGIRKAREIGAAYRSGRAGRAVPLSETMPERVAP